MKRLAPVLLAALSVFSVDASAKVLFTGYGEMRLNAYTPFRVYGDPAATAALGVRDPAQHHSRGFTFDNLGLFATTSVAERMDFKVDFTYRQLGNTVGQVRVQYAYLEHALADDFSYRAGKILLPFNYFNRKRFYPFQRVELQAPFFLNSILGLPIASIGVEGEKRFDLGGSRLDLDLYAVNGYGANPAAPNIFRSATVPGSSLSIANNLGANNNNANISLGARARLADLGGTGSEAGVSYFGGAWDTGGTKYFQMFGAHGLAILGKWEALLELLHLDVAGDAGFAASLADTHWMTDGYLFTLSRAGTVGGMPLSPYIATEGYRSVGHNGRGSQEKLQAYRTGVQLKPLEPVALKAEYGYLAYRLPLSTLGEAKLWAHQALLALVLTF